MKKETFIKKWDGYVIDDWCTEVSDDFRSFSRSFRAYMKTIADSCEAKIVNYHMGHYDISGFLEKDGKYVYFHYSEPRYSSIKVYSYDCTDGVLFRIAKSADDYRGGRNRFTCLARMDLDIPRLLALLTEGEDVA